MTKIAYETKKFTRSTLAVIRAANIIIGEYLDDGFILTLRQLFYQFVSRDWLANTERSYKRLGNIVSDGRRAGLIDWDAIEDRTRFMQGLTRWDNPKTILKAAVDSYHRDLWVGQDQRVEVWIEKQALVGVIEGVCNELDVPFFSCRGYPSDSAMWDAGARRLYTNEKAGQHTVILHLGDHDPSGIDMSRDIDDRLYLFTGGSGMFEVQRIALTTRQVSEYSPPPNPAKITDSRYSSYVAQYGNASWELDALRPQVITDLIRTNIMVHLDEDKFNAQRDIQEDEREKLRAIWRSQ